MRWALPLIFLIALPAHAEINFADLSASWIKANEGCRGGHGDVQETWHACGKRDAYAEILLSGGFCYDENKSEWREGEAINSEQGVTEISCK